MGQKVSGSLLMGIGLIFMGIGFTFLSQLVAATDAIVSYNYTGATYTFAQTANFTGLSTFAPLVPLLVTLAFVIDGVVAGFLGVRVWQGTMTSSWNIGSFLLIGLAVLFTSIGLRFYPTLLDGISSALYNNGLGISTTTYSAFRNILLVSPMLALLGFTIAAALPGILGSRGLAHD